MRVSIVRSAETDLLEGFQDDAVIVVAVLDCRQNPASITERLRQR